MPAICQNTTRDWHLARISVIIKKGSPGLCSNYRPISLLNIGYKKFAFILLQRLKRAGAESRIHSTQFGFKSGFGTSDALLLARRLIHQSIATKDGAIVLLALDWTKAFDSISPDSLFNALYRFDLPNHFVNIVRAIYRERQFFIKETGQSSSKRNQEFSIFKTVLFLHFFPFLS